MQLLLMKMVKSAPTIMGCYGIGVTRAIAAVIEQHHDDRGIVWPETDCPILCCDRCY